MSSALIVPAAGGGKRLGLGRPKALVDVGGTALVRRTIERFARIDGIDEAVVVAPAGVIPELQEALTGLDWPGCEIRVVAGGRTRQDSVRAGLSAIDGRPELVCVHDAARPMIARATIEAVLQAAHEHGAATAAARPVDSVREDVEGGGTRPLDRARLWLVQTPQAFAFELLCKAHEHARATRLAATDDASLVEQCTDRPVAIVESEGANFKVTTAEDLKMLRLALSGPGQR